MRLLDKMVEYFIRMNRRMKRWQRVVSLLSAVIVFVTTYTLILPAITLDKDTASTQAGIEVADSDVDVDENGTIYESEEEPAQEAAVEEDQSEEEDSSAESGSEEAVNEESDPSGAAATFDAEEQAEEASSNSQAAEESTEDTTVSTETAAEAASAATTNPAKEESPEDKLKAAIAAAAGKNADEIELITEDTQLVYENDDYYVYADFGKSAGLPVGVKLDVKEITEESDPEEYAFYYEKALAEMQDKYDEKTALSLAKFYDITFKYENVEIEPVGDVKVRIEYKKAVEVEKETKVDAVHFDTKDENEEPLDEEKAVVIDENKVDAERTETEIKAVEFESDKFSVYGIVYTVDFKWQVNGKTYEFSLPGGGFMSFEALLEVLGIAQDPDAEASESETAADVLTIGDIEISEKTKEFVADVEKVEFSKPELVWVGKVDEDSTVGSLKEANNLECQYSAKLTAEQIAEINAQTAKAGDWALISVQPFLSEETLTVTMKGGEQFTINVTDAQLKRTVITASGDAYEITVTYDTEAQIPDGAELKVEEILPADERYAEYYQKSLEQVGLSVSDEDTDSEEQKEYVRVFDIEIWADDQKIEPASDVTVSIKLLDTPKEEESNLQVLHFAKNGLEVMDTGNTEDAQGTNAELSFVTDEFSVYTVVDADVANLNRRSFVLVSGIANDPGATTGYPETWGQDYFTIIVNAHAVSNTTKNNGISSAGVHTWEEGGQSFAGGEVPEWTFESAGNGKYYLSVRDKNGNKKYLSRNNTDASLVDNSNNATALNIVKNSDGTVLIYELTNYWGEHRYYLNNEGNGEWSTRTFKFREYPDTNAASTRFKLCEKSDDFDSYAAVKTAASEITTNAEYVIYRKFADDAGNEALYALAHDGTLVRVYDGGDAIYWRKTDADAGKNIYWNYQMDGASPVLFARNPQTNEPVYINPNHSTGQTLSTEADGLTLLGKDNGSYGTTIERWDQAAYDYAGLHVTLSGDAATLTTGTRVAKTSDEFFFAIASQMPGATPEPVDTVDSDSLGIKITMFDYGDKDKEYSAGTKLEEMTNIAGSDEYTPHAAHALVKPYLEDGLPSSTSKGPMNGLFDSGGAIKYSQSDVNHLFVKSYYDENGTFRYRSEDNYAYLGLGGSTDFTVYRQAATPYTTDIQVGHTYYHHGHFMPFNDIDTNNNISRLMNQYGNDYQNGTVVGEIPVEDGRTYESIYGVQGIPNYYTGMKMEARFTQPRDGELENGDEMIFKFTGDDDMWVYIDDVLVLDIGGIHEPLSGTINFATGVVTNPSGSSLSGTTTIYQIFMDTLHNSGTPQSVKDKINAISWKDVNGDGTPDTFADYTNHSFSSFYMERGAGASNLDIQFNLKVTRTNEFTVEKELPDDMDERFINHLYKFQATFKDGNEEKPLRAGATKSNGDVVCNNVVYRDRKDANNNPIAVDVDENGYFYLKAGEAAVFLMADESIQYNVKEVDIDEALTDHVEINGEGVTINDGSAEAGYAYVSDRSLVGVKNYPVKQNLLITKYITEDSAPMEEGENPVFEFRVYLESIITDEHGSVVYEDDNPKTMLIPYAYGPYYLVKEVDGTRHYYTLTGENNTPEDKGTEPVICSTTGRSGSINSIPPEYTVIIPNLAVGTNFYLEERRDNIPDPYQFDHEDLQEDTYDPSNMGDSEDAIERTIARDEEDHQEFDPDTVGRIKSGVDAESHVYNKKPWPKTDITLKKVDKANINKENLEASDLLDGAAFILEKYKQLSPTEFKDAEWNSAHSTYNYGTNGVFEFKDIPIGIYKIVEKEYPTGYVKLAKEPVFELKKKQGTEEFEIVILDDAGGLAKLVNGQLVIVIGNEPGKELPDAGGPGSLIYTLSGLVLIIASALMYGFRLRRRERRFK